MAIEIICRIEAPHFVAGIIFSYNYTWGWRVKETAPILKYMRDWSPAFIGAYVKNKRWKHQWL